jgi:hypothetical protein
MLAQASLAAEHHVVRLGRSKTCRGAARRTRWPRETAVRNDKLTSLGETAVRRPGRRDFAAVEGGPCGLRIAPFRRALVTGAIQLAQGLKFGRVLIHPCASFAALTPVLQPKAADKAKTSVFVTGNHERRSSADLIYTGRKSDVNGPTLPESRQRCRLNE